MYISALLFSAITHLFSVLLVGCINVLVVKNICVGIHYCLSDVTKLIKLTMT